MLSEIFSVEHLTTLFILTALETVLGFDNLLYISLESKRVSPDRQAFVRRWGILLAIGLRIVLLFIVLHLISLFQDPIFAIALPPFMAASVSGHSLIVLAGGVFLMYTAIKEIFHMISMEEHADEAASRAMRSTLLALVWIVAMNVVFSFDTVLSAVALTKNFVVMTTAIILSGALMVLMADTVAEFLNRNRMYEVLGLFVLLLVGIMLTSEGGHIAELAFFGYHVEVMPKTTFYFVLAMLVLVEIVQGRYQRKLLKKKQANAREREATANA